MTTQVEVKTALLELADRCEKATGPDDATDWAIAEAIGCAPGLPYTASLDAAMTLVPEGWAIVVGAYDSLPGRFARLFPPDYPHSDLEHQASNGCATMPLALCAAALRARTTLGEDDD